MYSETVDGCLDCAASLLLRVWPFQGKSFWNRPASTFDSIDVARTLKSMCVVVGQVSGTSTCRSGSQRPKLLFRGACRFVFSWAGSLGSDGCSDTLLHPHTHLQSHVSFKSLRLWSLPHNRSCRFISRPIFNAVSQLDSIVALRQTSYWPCP